MVTPGRKKRPPLGRDTAKAIHCEVRLLDERGDRLELIQRRQRVEAAPPEVMQVFLMAVSDRHSVFQVDGTTLEYKPGDLMFFAPGQAVAYRTVTIPPQGTVYRGVELSAETIQAIMGTEAIARHGFPALKDPITTDERLSADLSDIHRDMLACNDGQDSEKLIRTLLGRLMAHPQAVGRRCARVRGLRPELARVIDYMHRNHASGVVLDELAEVARLSSSRLSHVFRESVGVSPHQYLIMHRVHRAKTLLCKQVPPAQVATATGFVDQAHLTRHFKRLTALTPGQYAASTIVPQPPVVAG